ncbi:MAG: heme lyase CcmF/NrfE family subunit [Xanthomonadaceae bacterium]|nr:heme lyase CcmF/NrfE family subunit [Xanthomonadaceae bacterium]
MTPHFLPELGQIALILALVVALLQTVLPMVGAQRGIDSWMAVARPAAWMQFLLVGTAFAILTHAFLVQDFSVRYVAANSNSLLPPIYRFTAVWGAHEGSLLLWSLILALWTAAVAAFSRALPQKVVARVLGAMGFVSLGFLGLLLFASNPFARLLPAAAEGRDLNPLLQDPGMIIHPPMLYMGYVGLSVPFAFAIAAMLDGRIDTRWLRWTRPWTNVAWAFLTLGIALGSWWAYYELGWGGWWFWDPVENASFMPWLVGTALLHSQAVTEKRGSFRSWTLLLAIAAFSLSLLGTFLVRSGAITSVHAFAADPGRGVYILIFLAAVVGGSLLLYALRAPEASSGEANASSQFSPASREMLLVFNNVLLAAAAAMVLIGTLYPLLADALELGKISVGPPYFSLMFVVLMAPLVLLLPFGPLTRWRSDEASRPLKAMLPWAALAVVTAALAYAQAPQGPWKTAAGVAGALWVGGGTALFALRRWRSAAPGKRYTAEMGGMLLAHTGVAVFLIGVLLVEAQLQQREIAMRPGQTLTLGRDAFVFEGVERAQGPNYMASRGTVRLLRDDTLVAVLHPEKREYASGGQVMTEAAIRPGVARDVFVALGEPLGGDAWAVRVQIKPFIRWIWGGALLMALGGLLAATDRRFRSARERLDARDSVPASAPTAAALAPTPAQSEAETTA